MYEHKHEFGSTVCQDRQDIFHEYMIRRWPGVMWGCDVQVFGPAFRRNSRWSVHTPVPTVGDEQTSWEEVDSFYDFWFQFKSWREFPHPDEEDLEQAECREEKR